MKTNVVTLSFFKYTGIRQKFWATRMMQFARPHLNMARGISNYKLLGAGSGKGFNPWPDFSTYALLVAWENEQLADAFIHDSMLFKAYNKHAHETWTIYHLPADSRGAWRGINPFKPDARYLPSNKLVCVLTRAFLNPFTLHQFWSYVPKINRIIDKQEGLLFHKGIGEWPVFEMATYSIWKDMDSMKTFAYNTTNHKGAIFKARKKNWFKEDLFARLLPFKSIGTWQSKNPLQGFL